MKFWILLLAVLCGKYNYNDLFLKNMYDYRIAYVELGTFGIVYKVNEILYPILGYTVSPVYAP